MQWICSRRQVEFTSPKKNIKQEAAEIYHAMGHIAATTQ